MGKTIPAQHFLPYDPLKGLDRYKMTKFTGDEKEYEFWKLSFLQSYGARQITDVEKVLYLLRSMEEEPHKLCKRYVRYQSDQTTYDTICEVLDRRYEGGGHSTRPTCHRGV